MHNWSDDSFDWEQLDEAIDMVASFMRFWGRIGVYSKEKFGTARIYVSLWDGSLHGMLYPGYNLSKFPDWLWRCDVVYISSFIRWTRFNRLVNWYQEKIYSIAYSRALKRFPKMKIELVIAADFDELIKEYPAIMAMYNFRKVIETLLER